MAGRGRGRTRRFGTRDKNAPVLDADLDSDEDLKHKVQQPTPLFPDAVIPKPDPFTEQEKREIAHYRKYRSRMREGPFFTILDPSIITDDRGKANARAGVDPFDGMMTYTKKMYVKPQRTLPDFSRYRYLIALKFFPRELWPTVDPHRKQPEWKSSKKSRAPSSKKGQSTHTIVTPDSENEGDQTDASDPDLVPRKRRRPEVDEDDEGSDIDVDRRKRRQKAKIHDPTKKRRNEKDGLEAEDEIEEAEPGDGGKEDGEAEGGDGEGEEESVVDSAFSDEEEMEGDYGDNFFDNGEGDDGDDGWGDDGGDEGGTY